MYSSELSRAIPPLLDRPIADPSRTRRPAIDEREVSLFDLSANKNSTERVIGGGFPSREDEAARRGVKAMQEPKVSSFSEVLKALPGEREEAIEKRIVLVSNPWLCPKPCRLLDDPEALTFIDYVK